MTFEKILRKTLVVGVFLIPFIPLFVAYFLFFPFITGKNFAFRILVELLFGGWLILMLYNPAYRPKFSWLLAAVVSFVGIIAIADIFGENPLKSIWSNFERMEGLVTLVHMLMYFLIAGAVLNTEKLWSRFWNTTIGVSAFIGLYGILQLAGFITINQGGVRLDATFGNATYLAVYMLFHIFIAALLLVRFRGESIFKWMYGVIIALQIFILYHTATRGAILGFLGGVLLAALLIALFAKEQKRLRKIAASTIALVIIVVGGFFLIKDSAFVQNSEVLNRFASISPTETTVSARFLVWDMAFEGIKERPILGWGQENFNFVFNKYYDPQMYAQEQWFDRVHNTPLDWLIAGGILGFLAYASIFLTGLYYLWSRRNTFFSIAEKSVLTGLLVAYTFHNLFVFDNLMSYVLLFTVMTFIYWSYKETVQVASSELAEIRDNTMISRIYAPAIIILTLFVVYAVNADGVRAARTLLQALAVTPSENQLELFEKALSYDSFGNQEIREQLAQLSTRVASSNLDIEMKQAYLSLSHSEMQKQTEEMPNDARTQVFTGTLLDAFGQYEKGLLFIERAHELSPQKQTILFQFGLNTLNRGDTQGAVEIFRQAFELAPAYEQARIFYAVGAIYAGNNALLEEILVPEFGSIVVDNDRLLQAYYNKGRFTEVLGIWKLRAEERPNDPQTRLGLAAAYLEAGQRQNSIAEIQKVIELDPNFRQQGEYLIREIRAGRNP